ncbi:MAG: hypothetical protein DRG83_17090 [Deltaproteobacteria bacterium]|nr:MAG: hypothetical protein DRG83_17090 [Deltaproteobacteria bacterium]
MKKEYRKRKGSDTWHWCTNCPYWPKSDYETWCGDGRPPVGELDNLCKKLERDGTCKTRTC